jgi:hypothetical protein
LRTIKSINHNNQAEEELFMSSQITTAFTQQYSNNVKLLAQEKGSQLRNTVTVESVVGKNAFFDQVGVATAVKRTTRHADTLQVDTPSSRRRVSLVDGLKNQVEVKFGKLLENLFKTISSQPI